MKISHSVITEGRFAIENIPEEQDDTQFDKFGQVYSKELPP